MSPVLKYTLGRLVLFLAVVLVLWPVPRLSLMVKLLVALVVSFALSWFLLARWRDEMSVDLDARVRRRRAEKARLRAALAGEDGPEPPPEPGPPGRDTPPGGGSRPGAREPQPGESPPGESPPGESPPWEPPPGESRAPEPGPDRPEDRGDAGPTSS